MYKHAKLTATTVVGCECWNLQVLTTSLHHPPENRQKGRWGFMFIKIYLKGLAGAPLCSVILSSWVGKWDLDLKAKWGFLLFWLPSQDLGTIFWKVLPTNPTSECTLIPAGVSVTQLASGASRMESEGRKVGLTAHSRRWRLAPGRASFLTLWSGFPHQTQMPSAKERTGDLLPAFETVSDEIWTIFHHLL